MADGTPLALLIEQCLDGTSLRSAGLGEGSVRSMYASIRAQLLFMRDAVADGRRPTIEDSNRITLGVIAVREFEDTDLEYCDLLCETAYRFRALAQLPELL